MFPGNYIPSKWWIYHGYVGFWECTYYPLPNSTPPKFVNPPPLSTKGRFVEPPVDTFAHLAAQVGLARSPSHEKKNRGPLLSMSHPGSLIGILCMFLNNPPHDWAVSSPTNPLNNQLVLHCSIHFPYAKEDTCANKPPKKQVKMIQRNCLTCPKKRAQIESPPHIILNTRSGSGLQ